MSSFFFLSLGHLCDPFSCFIECLKVGGRTHPPFKSDVSSAGRRTKVCGGSHNGIAKLLKSIPGTQLLTSILGFPCIVESWGFDELYTPILGYLYVYGHTLAWHYWQLLVA